MVSGTSWVNPPHQARSAGPSERGQVRPLRGPAELGADRGGAGARGALDPMPDGQPCSCRPEARSALDGRVGMGSNDGVLSAERAPLERPAAHTRGLPIRREPDQDEARSRVAASVSEGGPCSLIRASAMLSHPRRLPGGGEPGARCARRTAKLLVRKEAWVGTPTDTAIAEVERRHSPRCTPLAAASRRSDAPACSSRVVLPRGRDDGALDGAGSVGIARLKVHARDGRGLRQVLHPARPPSLPTIVGAEHLARTE
jgi:hypothetical protein